MMPGAETDVTRDAVLADAVRAWADVADPAVSEAVGDVADYLRAYYLWVATEDLAPPARLARVAAGHAALGTQRPQGRALVQVSEGAPGEADLVVDIVTDDMPYLVDTVTTALNKHRADIDVLIHPLLHVRRDVAGALSGAGESDGAIESWIHVEIGRPADRVDAGHLVADLRHVLEDVRVVVEDHQRMVTTAIQLCDRLAGQLPEAAQLLRWLTEGHFTFLGYREYDLVDVPDGVGLLAVPGSGLGILRHDRQGKEPVTVLPPEVRAKAQEPGERLVLAKANSRSTVYRSNYLDHVSVKKLAADGSVAGEWRFLGLYTYAAHAESITQVPVLRKKVDGMLATLGLDPQSHDGKDVIEILQTYPREELFEISGAELAPIALGVLRLRERRQTRLFLRRDSYGRYMSCLVYLPRERYTTVVRLRAQEILREAMRGSALDYSAMVGDSALARLHVVVRGEQGRPVPQLSEIDLPALERLLAAAVRSWDEDLAAEAARILGEQRARALLDLCRGRIPETYKADVPAADAVADLSEILRLREAGAAFGVKLEVDHQRWTLRVYRTASPITLSEVLPQLQHMGLDVVDEHPYEFGTSVPPTPSPPPGSFWLYNFGLRLPAVSATGTAPGVFEEALTALWHGQTEDDGFNSLVLTAGLTWREVTLLRGGARWLRQAGMRFSEDYIQRVLRANAAITRLLVRLFESRFDPARQGGVSERCEAITEELRGQLDDVVSLDHDRILRAYLALIEATLRTNYYQPRGRDYLVLKIDPDSVPGVVLPRPQFEIYVYSPRFEAVHLRFGPVARGGLRASDRQEDFRTEVLGLVKAQEVKNAVIVPSGAKGGFVCKRLPDPSERDAFGAEVLACYKTFISAMLDVTDNIVHGVVVPPADLVRRDGDDPYLVVAADKGTATFSDTANGIAAAYGFWLGDAFASGGSEGYDHKGMGITARGAWESVKIHFAALGMNPATTEFTAVGIGDMSGDVFGNGMLLSDKMKLVAAFDHRHIFVDPAPSPDASFAERRRLFDLPRSSWADYSPELISAGGGVWPRSVKSIPLSPQARDALGFDASVAALAPDELISAILRAPVDLLWNGGIGTYVKGSAQSHADVGDRTNDAVRVNGAELRAKVVGEGGNLGLTQAGRVEFALHDGLVNTDFIDNSAGVDTSDHEVNIKILLADAIRSGALAAQDRHGLLTEMTDEVAALVLRHNYEQNMALAIGRLQSSSMLHVHARYMRKLVRDKRLHQESDVLPTDRDLAERRSAGLGLTNAELSLLLAHTKIAAGQDVVNSSLPDDPHLQRVLVGYFPGPLRVPGLRDALENHQLRREIITTAVVNEMVDYSGTTFLFRLNEETGASVPDLTRAWLVAREVFEMPAFWQEVESLDGIADLSAQMTLLLEGRKLTERTARWLLHNRRPPFDIQATVAFFADGVRTVRSALPKLLTGRDLAGFEERRDSYVSLGVPVPLAEQVAGMVPTYSAFDIVQTGYDAGRSVEETAEVYFDLADRLQIARLLDRITALPREDRWSTMARAALRDDLYAAHASLTADVLAVPSSGALTPEDRLAAWESRNEAAVSMAGQTLAEIWESERFTFTTLSVALRAIRTLVTVSSLPHT